MTEELIDFDKFNSFLTRMEVFKRIYIYILETLPGLEIAYIPDFILKISYYREDEEINDDFLYEECSRLQYDLHLSNDNITINKGAIKISV